MVARVRSVVATVLATVLVLAAPAAPTTAAPTDVCAPLIAAFEAVRQRIVVHNAQPNVFDQNQTAALAAYNAEAAQLTAEQASAQANAQACVDAMSSLASGNSTLDVNPPPERLLATLQNAKDKIPNGFVPPAPPVVGKNWRVPKNSPPRDLYDALRADNPGNLGNAVLQGSPRPVVGGQDPAYPNLVFGANKKGASAASPDHIVPIAEQLNMPGFLQLPPEYMYVVTRSPVNFQWLSWKANLSKQSRSVAGMSGVDPAWQAAQVQLEAQTRASLEAAIARLLASRPPTTP
ncbi:hypothetical protein [Cellulomonas fengjieae]|uniref:Lipoprotein n=1 Tax=Cellulomonas fengjieae TaxID=2819978 RepID=A0ABS3SBA6_9CELL|nr:hypothetical protein [Cellulomonas fengjieae]MBO3083038.1 hypothetical protein [Cellulomonas fengjieae]QVI65591.1 hypothetical protein KG102_16080 [Cellulomonas fengjieae]